MENRFRRKVAAFLAAVMFTTSLPVPVIAEDSAETLPVETVETIPETTIVLPTEPETEPVTEPVTEPATEPVTEPDVQPTEKTKAPLMKSVKKAAVRSNGITLQMVSSEALIGTLVEFAVSAPGADTYTVEWYDAERNFISSSEKTLTEGAGTFQSVADALCTEIIVVSAEIDGVTYTDEMTVVYTSLGKTPGIPQITCEEMPVAYQPYKVTWAAVDGADYYYLYWKRPGGLYLWRKYLEGTSYTIPADQITAEGEYCLQVAAMKAGYDIGEMAEKKFVVIESAVDDRVSITASKTQMIIGDVVQIVVSAPGAEAIRLYNVTADSSWYDEKSGERHEAGYSLTQDRTFYAMALYDGVWVASESITVTVSSNGKLDAPKVTVPFEVPAGKDVTVSWIEVANAERYWVQLWHDNDGSRGEFIKGFDPDGETSATLDHVLEPGSYRIVVLAIAEGYENGQSVDAGFTVTGELAAPPILTLDAEKHVYGSKITYTITAEGAEAIRLRYYGIGDDGDSWNQSFAFDADGTTTVYERDIHTAGSFSAVASVKINGMWSAWSDPVPFEVRYLGELTAPVIDMKDSYAAGEEITISWNAVENAEDYDVDLYDGAGDYLRSFYPGTGTTVTISEVLEAGDYQVQVCARTEGYKQSQSTASFRVTGELAAPPVLSLDAETYVASSEITYTITTENAELIRLFVSGTTDEGYRYSDTYEFLPDGTTTTEKKNFSNAGSFSAVASVKVNGAWSAWSEPVSFEVRYLGELTVPVLSMRDSYAAGAEIEISWSAVENAESYGVSLHDSEGNNIKNWWVDSPETSIVMNMALDAGDYAVSVYARKQGWRSSDEARKEFVVTGQLAEGPSFTVESYTVVTGKDATFTVFMEGATKFRLLCDERVTEHAAENGAAAITRTLYGNHKQVTAQISACVKGIWTDYGPSQTIYIMDKPLLGAVKVTVPETVRAGEDIEIIWEPVEHAENYSVRVETSDGETEWSDYLYAATEECCTVIPAGELKQGSYALSVVAMAQEYSAAGCNIQLDVQAPLPENAFRYYVGTNAQINEYLGDPVPEELEIPAMIHGAAVVSVFGPLFENGCNGLRITIPASVTYIAGNSFDGCTDLTICGYSGSQAEEYAILNGHSFEALDNGQTAITAEWAEALVNKEMIFTVSAPGVTEVVMYEGGNSVSGYDITVLLTDGGASVRWTPEKTGIHCIRFEAKVNGQWLTTKNYALEVTSIGQMPQVRNLKPSAATVEPGTAVSITWDDPEGLTATIYGVNVIRPGYDVDDYSYWYPVNPGITSYTFDSYYFETEGTYLLAVRTEPASGYEASVTTCTVEVKSTRLWDFNPEDNQLLAYHGTDKEIVVPAEIDGVPVWYIAGSVFADSDVTSVVIPEGVKHIYRGVFQNCTSLTSVSLPSTMSYIGEYAFYGCKSLTQITLPKNLSFLGYYAFYNCDALTAVTIPAGITELYSETFYSCDALTQVILPDGLTEIGSFAFSFCSSLKTITIPQSVTTIDRYAFEYVEDLTICGYLGSAAEDFAEEQGYDFVALDAVQTGNITFTLERDTLYCSGLMNIAVTAPDAEKLRLHLDGDVYEYNIYNGSAAISRRIHETGEHSVTVSQYVDGKWLAPCEALTFNVIDMEKPEIQPIASVSAGTLVTIYWKPVEGAVDFTLELSVDGNGVATYYDIVSQDKDGFVYQQLTAGDLAHAGIYTVQITANAEDGGYAQSSRTFEVTKAEEFLYEVNEDGTATVIGHTGGGADVIVPAELDNHTVVKIAGEAFLNSNAVSITLPTSVEVVDQWAFRDCKELETVKINGQATIRMAVFKDCNKLVNIYIGAGVFLEDDALEGCRADAIVYGYSGGRVEEVAGKVCGFSALGELAEGPVITAEDIWQNEKLNYTVTFENASRLYIQEIYPNGSVDSSTYAGTHLEDVADSYSFADLTEDSLMTIKAAALVDGEWTAYTEKKVTVSVLKDLTAPVFEEIGSLERHVDQVIKWYPVEDAQQYRVIISSGMYVVNHDETVDIPEVTLKAGSLQEGDYTIQVTAMAEGYEDASASAEFEMISLKLNQPVITADPRIARHLGAVITWEPVPIAENYTVVVQTEGINGPMSLYRNAALEATELVLTPEQLKVGNCTVSVTANALYCTSSDAATAAFEIYEEQLSAPEITAPETVTGGVAFDITWKSVATAEKYHLEIVNGDNYRIFSKTADSSTLSQTVRLDLCLPEETLTLRVIASADYRIDGVAEQPLHYKPLYTYEVVDGNAVITGYNGSDPELNIPGRINGYKVIAIGDGAFEGNSSITGVYLDDAVELIGDRSFKNCTALQRITGQGIREIGEEAFYNCTSLTHISFGKYHSGVTTKPNAFYNTPITDPNQETVVDGLLNIVITDPSEVKDLSHNLFVETVTYKEGITEIPARTHYNNTLLRKVVLPKSLKTIGSEAFAECSSLREVWLYDSVEEIAEDAFSNSDNLCLYIRTSDMERVSYVEQYAVEHNILFEKVYVSTMISVIYPEGTYGIAERDHFKNEFLQHVHLPESLQFIQSKAFAQCENLAGVYMYDGITSIADDAFEGSDRVRFVIYVTDPETVSYVEKYANNHNIPYTKLLKNEPVSDSISLGDNAGPITVKIDTPVQITVIDIPTDADHLNVYNNGTLIFSASVNQVASTEFSYTFRQFGQQILTAEALRDGEVIKHSGEKTVIVTGIRLTADKDIAWTCEPVSFTVETYPVTAALHFYAEELQFGSVSLKETVGTLTYAFTEAGDRQITVRSDSGLVSETLVLPVLCVGQLDQPVLEAEELQYVDDGLVCSWDSTENTDGYVLYVRYTNGQDILQRKIVEDGSDRMTCTISAEELGGEGAYQLYLMNYGYKYDQNESETVTVELTADRTPRFSMDKQMVMTGEPVTFTFYAVDADVVELWADGEVIETISLTNGHGTLTRAFTKSGNREMAIRAQGRDGWTELSEIQILTVTSRGILDTVQVMADPVQLLGDPIKASWNAVEHATGYTVYFRNAEHETIWKLETADCAVSVPADLVQMGSYYFLVVASGTGYDQSEGSANVTVVDHLPGPVILTPAENEVCTNTATVLTWQAVESAESYVVSLARKTGVDANGQPVYEKVWAAPGEVINVGTKCSYDLTGLAYGDEYRVAVGTVSTLDSGDQRIGWSERLFRVELPELTVTMTADILTPSEGGQTTLTVTASHPMTQAVLTDESGAVVETVSAESKVVDGSRIFTFVVTHPVQGKKTYTAIISGTGDLADIGPVSASLEIQWLEANAAAIRDVVTGADALFAGTNYDFTIHANPNTARVHVYLVTESGETWLATRRPPNHAEGEWIPITDLRLFEEPGQYHLKYVPYNGAGEAGAEYNLTVIVQRLPAPVVTNLMEGDIVPRENYTVTWTSGAEHLPDIRWGVTLYRLAEADAETGTPAHWEDLPGCFNVVMDGCSYTLPELTQEDTYRIEIYPIPAGKEQTTAQISDCTVIHFTYRTVPAFHLTDVDGVFGVGEPVTVRWEAPVWRLDPAMKPDKYVIHWYRGSERIYSVEIGGSNLEATLPGNYVLDGVHTVDVYAMLDKQQQKADGDNLFEIQPPTVTITKRTDPFTVITGEPFRVEGTVTGGITKVLVQLVTAGNNSRIVPIRDADGNKVEYLVVDVADGAYTVELNPAKDLEVSQGDKTNYGIEVYGFLRNQTPQVGSHAASDWCMVDVDDVQVLANGYADNHWLFTDEAITIAVKTPTEVTKVWIYDGNQRLDVEPDTSDPNCNLFRAYDLASRKEGLHEITAVDAETGKLLGTVDVYVVTRAERVQVYCIPNVTAKAWRIPAENYKEAVTVTENSHLMQRGVCGEYVLVEIDSGVSRFIHRDFLEMEKSEFKLLKPLPTDVIVLSEVKDFEIQWTPMPGAKSYTVKLTTHYVNRKGKESSLVVLTETVNATNAPEQTLTVKSSVIIDQVQPLSSLFNVDWVTDIEITINY